MLTAALKMTMRWAIGGKLIEEKPEVPAGKQSSTTNPTSNLCWNSGQCGERPETKSFRQSTAKINLITKSQFVATSTTINSISTTNSDQLMYCT
jgi:hypothetical protein